MAGFPSAVLGFLLLLGCIAGSWAASLQPLNDAEKAAIKALFISTGDGSYGSLEETYQAVSSLNVLKNDDMEALKKATCEWTDNAFKNRTDAKDSYHVLKIAQILSCPQKELLAKNEVSSVLESLKQARSLVHLYYSVGALSAVKQILGDESEDYVSAVSDVMGILKNLDANDGTWQYDEREFEQSARAAGLAFEIAAGVVQIAGFEAHKTEIESFISAAGQLFDYVESDDDGTLYFEEMKSDKAAGSGGVIAASATVLRGIAALASVDPGVLQIGGDKFYGLAQFFLSIRAPTSTAEAFYQLDALSLLEHNSIAVPLVLFLPSSVVSLTTQSKLEVAVTTVLGSPATGVAVTLVSAHKASGGSPILTQEKLYHVDGSKHAFDFVTDATEVGKYNVMFEVDPSAEISKHYVWGGSITALITVTGLVTVSDVELAVLDSDTGSAETAVQLDFHKKDNATLSANHLQKFQLSFKLTSPTGVVFRPHQVFVKLLHESRLEHAYLVKDHDGKYELILDFLGLVEKLYYLSGTYSINLIVGDFVMENSFLWSIGSLDLDLPEAPEDVDKPPAAPLDIAKRYGPKPEIAHIFRQPEKRPAGKVSFAFFVLTLLPLFGFFIGLWFLGVNAKNFPTKGLQLVAAITFHGILAAILGLYALFWLKLNLFTTLKALGLFGVLSVVPGHYLLSYMADSSSKLKTA